MQALASFIMRGRAQALLVAVLCAASVLLAWISAAAVALVTLRKGPGEGAWLLMWALLPALVLAYHYGDASVVALLLGSAVLALTLRASMDLSLTLLVAVAIGVLAGGLVLALAEAYLAQIRSAVIEPYWAYMEELLARGGDQPVTLPRPGAAAIAGMVGAGSASMSVLSLLLARYWQAALYNPGGFGDEFRALRYPPAVTTVLVLAFVGLYSLTPELRTWAMIAVLPLVFAGLGLVHARARHRGWGVPGLALFYLAWLLIGAVQLLVVILAAADSWMDFRRRWAGDNERRDN